MRRLVLWILTATGLALPTACGGSAFSSGTSPGTITSVAFTNGSGQADNFFVSPTGTTPLQVNAIGVNGSGVAPQYSPNATFTWGARYVNPNLDPPSVADYLVGSSSGSQPSSYKVCPAEPSIQPPIPILIYGGSGTPSTLYPGYTLLPPTQAAKTVYIGSVPGLLPFVKPYCLRLEATPVGGGSNGGVTVVVSNNP